MTPTACRRLHLFGFAMIYTSVPIFWAAACPPVLLGLLLVPALLRRKNRALYAHGGSSSS